MACIDTMPAVESEMEEGEIVDDLDDLSDISSEEEFLLRQRLQVLENYNNVLERKKAKGSPIGSGKKKPARKGDGLLQDLSEISASELDDYTTQITVYRNMSHDKTFYKRERYVKPQYKQKKKKDPLIVPKKEHKKRTNHRAKKKPQLKVISESSEESDDEYRNKRRKLANAVVVTKDKVDKTTLKARLDRMLHGTDISKVHTEEKVADIEINAIDAICASNIPTSTNVTENIIENVAEKSMEANENEKLTELIIDDSFKSNTVLEPEDTLGGVLQNNNVENKCKTEENSDEDLELLRQHALKTKTAKSKTVQEVSLPVPELTKPIILSEDEDSDTAELRLICLKSALLKKAIEMKQKQKLKKRLSSQSSNIQDELITQDKLVNEFDIDNNTDIESVDMEIGSDAEERGKEASNNIIQDMTEDRTGIETLQGKDIPITKTDEVEEDEDLLRAMLLTSLSKNLPNLVDPNIANEIKSPEKKLIEEKNTVKTKPLPEKRFIITLGESDSEGEHEATKNLTKMHMKLSEQVEFQEKLDMFLKSTRMEVEKTTLPDVVQQPDLTKPTKFVAKAVNNLPKSEQIEYKNLVKRMAELEKMKQARQNLLNKVPIQAKDTLKPRNVTTADPTKLVVINNLDEQIAKSRKKIAEESAKMLKLKEEGTKLAQKYKIVATELRNIATAINFNRKEQKLIQGKLSKTRLQHQTLIRSSSTKQSKNISQLAALNHTNKLLQLNKLQKENNPTKKEFKNLQLQKSVKVSIVNDLNDNPKPNRLSVQIDVTNNKKTVKMPSPVKNRVIDIENDIDDANIDSNDINKKLDEETDIVRDKTKEIRSNHSEELIQERGDMDDYRSPLQALTAATWGEDPNAFLCPFEVGGNCKDPDCKYLHPKIPSHK